jgi:hypothetical protein
MHTARLILSIVILLLAGWIVAMNWSCVIVSIRNKRRGIDRHHSTVPFVSFLLVVLAHLVYPKPDNRWMLALPLLDIANWSLLALPYVLVRGWAKKKIETRPAPEGRPRPQRANPRETEGSDR